MRTASLGLAIFWVAVGSAAWSQGDFSADDVRNGHHLAAMVCAVCHLAADDQPTLPILRPPAPPFAVVAQRKDISADSLQKFLTTTHRNLATQQGMPNPDLADFQVKEVIAYLLSLRK